MLEYYRNHAKLWEIQALLKARPVAGQRALGSRLLDDLRSVMVRNNPHELVVRSIWDLREQAMKTNSQWLIGEINIKSGAGGIRDIEFFAQGLQMIHLSDHPDLITGNTLDALKRLSSCGLLPDDVAHRLAENYILLRRIEHHLQIWEDQQIHALPRDAEQLQRLARRIFGTSADADNLLKSIGRIQNSVTEICDSYLYGPFGRE
jgi:glutamate-ammonia-ligase adenylyltransferase